MTEITTTTRKMGAEETEIFRAKFGAGRSVAVRRLDLGDQYDISELMGADVSPTWVSMTLLAASVTDIDDKPVSPKRDKSQFRATLRALGEDGVAAARDALNQANGDVDDVEAAHRRDVGNSSGAEPSAR